MGEWSDEQAVVGRRVKVVERVLTRRDGRKELREMVVHPGSVVVLPVLDDGRIVMIQNHRFAVDSTLLELCAGTRELDPDGAPEDVTSCAARELEEETGYRASTIEPLLSFYPAPGMSNEHMFAFVARGLVQTAQNLDPTEHIEVVLLTLAQALDAIRQSQIRDAKTIATLLYFHTWAQTGL
jgi:ADP-ribose pyrophosphatase